MNISEDGQESFGDKVKQNRKKVDGSSFELVGTNMKPGLQFARTNNLNSKQVLKNVPVHKTLYISSKNMANANTNTSNFEIEVSELNKAPTSSNNESNANSSKEGKISARMRPLKIIRNED